MVSFYKSGSRTPPTSTFFMVGAFKVDERCRCSRLHRRTTVAGKATSRYKDVGSRSREGGARHVEKGKEPKSQT